MTAARDTRLGRRALLVALVLVLALLLVASARAGNAPDLRLDAAATEIAGHPVSVHCEAEPAAWAEIVAANFPGTPFSPDRLQGFAPYGGSVVYLSPANCLTLRAELKAEPPAGLLRFTGEALMTLLHESIHARGVVDEHSTDCAALGLLRHYAVNLLLIPERVYVSKLVPRVKRVKVKGRWVRRTVRVRVRVLVPNPRLTNLIADVVAIRNCAGVTP